MKRAILPVGLALLSAACGQQADVDATNASVAEVAAQVREASRQPDFIKPGRWRSTIVIESISAPGMPAEAAARLRQMMGDGRQFESCLSPDEVKRPQEDFFAGASKQCRYEHFTMGGGRIDARMRCSDGGVSRAMEMKGEYRPDSYGIAMTASLEPPSGGGPRMTMRSRVESRRVGECSAERS